MKTLKRLFMTLAIALMLSLAPTTTTVHAASTVDPFVFSCTDQAIGPLVNTVTYVDITYGYTNWMTSAHHCVDGTGAKSGAIFVSNIHGGTCKNGDLLQVRIEYTTGKHGREYSTRCGSTDRIQVGTEKSLTGPKFRFLIRHGLSTDKWTDGKAST